MRILQNAQLTLALILVCILTHQFPTWADVVDPLDNPINGSIQTEQDTDAELDQLKSPDQLIAEAEFLLHEERPLDARTKLLRVLEKDPKAFRAHMLLADYYMVSVGHFRLALKHVKQAEKLFEETRGAFPYENKRDQLTHSQLLYLLSQARLNLDDYQGSLDVLDQFAKFGYTASWYPGTRAWVLMKLGRVDEAIREAKRGVLIGGEPGRTLNMLGILLSMHGDREESIKVFKEAIAYELSQGDLGQPATPLNNSGEVFKEVFDEEKAESSWLKAISMPDGCEHVLPSLNLSLLYIDELNLSAAKRTMDSFESCVAQFPLRNGEEHRALVSLALGRVLLLSGRPDEAIEKFAQALEHRQWFGKIGTSEGDLKAAALVSMAQAYRAKENVLKATLTEDLYDWFFLYGERKRASLLSWWYLRKARQVLAADLNDFEDLTVRNTDSLLEYPTLGDAIAEFSSVAVQRKMQEVKGHDRRKDAFDFYKAYHAQSLLEHHRVSEGLQEIESFLPKLRPKFDDLLALHSMGIALQHLEESDPRYTTYSDRMFSLSRPSLRLYGEKLVITLSSTVPEAERLLYQAGFLVDNSSERLFSIKLDKGQTMYTLNFTAPQQFGGPIRLKGQVLEELINRLADTLFVEYVR